MIVLLYLLYSIRAFQSGALQDNTTIRNFNEPDTQKHSKIITKVGFNFKVDCHKIAENNCDLAKIALESAGGRFANELILKRPINVLVKFEPFGKENNRTFASTVSGPKYRTNY